jgi:hypothetical protein
MFGRHAERDQVLEFLLQAEPPAPVTAANPGPGVLRIIGPALIGKSTLVEHVCNDKMVRGQFSLNLLHTAAGSASLGGLGTMATLRDNCTTKHQNNTEDERWLLVIELSGDVDDEAWNNLFYSRGRKCMPRGSKVILTSRSKKIERFGTTRAVRLKCLSMEAMWYFFKLSAFGSADPEEHHKLASVARGHGHGGQGAGVIYGHQHHGRHGEGQSQQLAALVQGSRDGEALHAEEPRAIW